MRVLQVMESTIGGTRRHIVDVTRGLLREGVETHLVASAEREPAFREDLSALEAEGARVTTLPMVREVSPLTDYGHYRLLKRILRDVRPDIIHTHSSKAGVLGRRASLATGVGKRVHTPHTFAFLFSAMFSPGKRALYRRIESHLGARTDRMVAVSESEAETIRAAGVIDGERVRVVANGIDASGWLEGESLSRAELGVPEGAPLALIAGLLNSAKGQDVAIGALVEPGLEALHLLLAGHGDWQSELEALGAKLGVSDRVHFLGWRNDLPVLMHTVEFVMVPSRWEGMPYVVLEAGASAKPVVGTRVDGVRELVADGQTGFLVDVEAPVDLARAVRLVLELSSEDRQAMGLRARARVLETYGVESMVRGLREVYEELL